MSQFRDRIKEVRRMKASELLDNDGNWRIHPDVQKDSLIGVLHEIGKADVIKAYRSERAGGALVLYDGHLRKTIDPDEEWQVAITDLTDAEADKMLLLGDPIASLAEMDGKKVLALTETVMTDDLAVREMLRRMEMDAQHLADDEGDEDDPEKEEKRGPVAMELMPFEHYDYVLLMFKNELDWLSAVDTLNLEKRSDQRKTHKIGLARVIDGKRVIARLQKAEFELAAIKSGQAVRAAAEAAAAPAPASAVGFVADTTNLPDAPNGNDNPEPQAKT
jgi:hypothetical protein